MNIIIELNLYFVCQKWKHGQMLGALLIIIYNGIILQWLIIRIIELLYYLINNWSRHSYLFRDHISDWICGRIANRFSSVVLVSVLDLFEMEKEFEFDIILDLFWWLLLG